MRLFKYLEILDEISPFEFQESWDNSGLIVGDVQNKIQRVYLSLDIQESMFETIEENSLIIVHHPLIFKSISMIDFSKYPSNIIKKAIKKDISIVAMHTNFDKTHLNRFVLESVLGYEMSENDGFLAYFKVEKELDAFAKEIAKKLQIENIRIVKGCKYVKKAAICTGSGASLFSSMSADCLLTADIKYHDAVSAIEEKKSFIDIGHFESERYFARCLQKELQNKGLNGIIANSKNPFSHIKG